MEGNESKRARRQLSHQLSLLQSTSLAIHSHTLPLSHAGASRNAHSSRKPMYSLPRGVQFQSRNCRCRAIPSVWSEHSPSCSRDPRPSRSPWQRKSRSTGQEEKKKKKKGAPVWKGATGKQRTVVTSPASTGLGVPCFSGSQSPLLYNKKVGLKQWFSLECVLEDL